VGRLSQRNDRRRVSRSTVYRTISTLEEAGLLRRVARTNDRDVHQHNYGYPRHKHLICRETRNLIEVASPLLHGTLLSLPAKHGFRMEGHRLEVYGLSAEACRPKKRSFGRLDRI